MGKIIKINIYAESKNIKKRELDLYVIEEVILKYNKWLRDNNKEDKLENYKEFLQAQ